MLSGTYEHTVDSKGRVFIPAKFRLDLGQKFYVTLSYDGCIRAYNSEQWGLVCEKLANIPAKSLKLKRRILATTSEVELDSQGRILLPESLRLEALIFEKTKIVGMNEWAEFWAPEKFDKVFHEETTEADLETLEAIGLA